MTESRIDDLLDELVPAFEPRTDGWEDVLARAHTTRRRYALLAVAALALLLVPTAVALRGRIADLFQGTPAPPAVSTSFEANNKVADMATQKGFGARFPHAYVSQAHGVIEIRTADGPQDLWSAPNDQGGTCYFVDWANDAPGPDGQQFGFGGCSQSSPPSSGIGWGSIWSYAHPNLLTVYGQVYVPAARVHVQVADGSALTLPIAEDYFLGSLPNGVKVEGITAYDDSGNVVATSTRTGQGGRPGRREHGARLEGAWGSSGSSRTSSPTVSRRAAASTTTSSGWRAAKGSTGSSSSAPSDARFS